MRLRTGTMAASAVLAAAVLAGCSGDMPTSTGDAAGTPTMSEQLSGPATGSAAPTPSRKSSVSAEAGSRTTVTIEDFEYDVPTTVPAGAELQVTNKDTTAHTFSVDGAGGGVGPGATEEISAPTEPGTYEITCYFHGEMKGSLVVS